MTTRTTPPFRFKRFTVQQSRSAMKVGFDGILLGAWASVGRCQRILDVGTGTGLVALMLAQRTWGRSPEPQIDAIEIDDSAINDASENFADSPWQDRLQLIHDRFQAWCERSIGPYDLIVSNPPYFQDSLPSKDSSRTTARHDRDLDVRDLLSEMRELLTNDGRLSLILPTETTVRTIEHANQFGLFCRRRTSVRALPTKPPHRELLEFCWTAGELTTMELTIEEEHHLYTDSFRELARDFYLAF